MNLGVFHTTDASVAVHILHCRASSDSVLLLGLLSVPASGVWVISSYPVSFVSLSDMSVSGGSSSPYQSLPDSFVIPVCLLPIVSVISSSS